MVTCHHPSCSLNQQQQCAAPGDVALDERAQCFMARDRSDRSLEEILEFLKRFGTYPYDEEKDREFLTELLQDFPTVNVLDQLKEFQAWVLDRDNDRKIGYRTAIRKWVKRSQQWDRCTA
jgi:hypothetical protein